MTATASTAVPPATPPESGTKKERTVYRAGGGRRAAFSFVFLLFLPFFVSLPAMLYLRVSHGLWFDTIGLAVMAFAFALLMGLIVAELIKSLRKRIDIGSESVKLTVPAGQGPTPKFGYRRYEVPYSRISAIETRREVYGGTLAPVMLRAARILTKDGETIPIGYVSEANTDPAFPIPEIARQIAERAGVPVLDHGTVRRSVRRRLLGQRTLPGQDQTVSEAQIAALNAQHNRVVLVLVFLLAALVGTGIALDILGITQ